MGGWSRRRSENLVTALGAYGWLVSPPHYLVPYGVGIPAGQTEAHVLADLGYRTQQIAVRLTEMGIGSCYVGALHREDAARANLGLPPGARIGAALVFGAPARDIAGRAVNALIRRAARAARKIPAESLFYQGTFDQPGAPPPELAPLIEAARAAPSAGNAQPWRFLWREGTLYLYVRRDRAFYRVYRYHDGGCCMANVTLALRSLSPSLRADWHLLGEEDDLSDVHPVQSKVGPARLEPLARLAMETKDLGG